MSTKEHKQKIWEMISDIGVCMLTSTDDGQLRSRPMQLVQKDYDGTIWFFVKKSASSVDEILENREVCLSFSCPEKKTYVSLTGKASLSQDENLKDKFWSPFVSAWFPEGKKSTDCALLEIKIESGEHWTSDLNSAEYLFEVFKSNFSDRTPASNDGIESQKFN